MKVVKCSFFLIVFALLPGLGTAHPAPAEQAQQLAQPLPPMVEGIRGVIRTYPSPTTCQSNCIAIQRLGQTDVITWRGIHGQVKEVFAVAGNSREQALRPPVSMQPNSQNGHCTEDPPKNCVNVIHEPGYDIVIVYGPNGEIKKVIIVPHTKPK